MLRLSGPLFFASQAGVEAAIAELGPMSHLIVDVSALSTIDVSGATALAQALRRVAMSGTSVRVRALGRELDALLRWSFEHHARGLIEIERAGGTAAVGAVPAALAAGATRPQANVPSLSIPGLHAKEEGAR